MWFEILRNIFAVIGALVVLLVSLIFGHDALQSWMFYRAKRNKK